MNKFVNRTAELEALGRAYGAEGPGLYVLYGRRRLGKTALLRQFAAGLPAVYHMADRTVEREAVGLLAQSMAQGLGEPSRGLADYPDWYALFAAFDRLRPRDRKTVLILDEYQYLWPDRTGKARLGLFSRSGFTDPVREWARTTDCLLVEPEDLAGWGAAA